MSTKPLGDVGHELVAPDAVTPFIVQGAETDLVIGTDAVGIAEVLDESKLLAGKAPPPGGPYLGLMLRLVRE